MVMGAMGAASVLAFATACCQLHVEEHCLSSQISKTHDVSSGSLLPWVQGMLGLPSKEPGWSSSLAGVMHSNCFDAAEDADVATCVAVLHQLLLRMQQVLAPHARSSDMSR